MAAMSVTVVCRNPSSLPILWVLKGAIDRYCAIGHDDANKHRKGLSFLAYPLFLAGTIGIGQQ